MPAVALTDRDGMYAAVPFYQAAKAAGIKPIVGVVVEVSDEWRVASDESPRIKSESRDSAAEPLVLLAMDMEGYSNLCRLTTLRQLGALQLGEAGFAERCRTADHDGGVGGEQCGSDCVVPGGVVVADGKDNLGKRKEKPHP